MDDLMNAELNDIISHRDDVIIGDSNEGDLQNIGELHGFIMPDGSKVLIDRFGNIIR